MDIQKTCITTGIVLIGISLFGAFFQTIYFFPHTTLHILSFFALGLVLIASGASKQKIRARNAAISIGSILFLLGIGGFILGSRGVPSYGEFRVDDKMLVIIPRALEFETFNHLIHGILGIILLVSFYIEKRKEDAFSKITVYLQTRKAR